MVCQHGFTFGISIWGQSMLSLPWIMMLLMNSLHFVLYLHPNQARKICGSLRSEPVQNLNRTLGGPDRCSVWGSPIFPEPHPRSGLGFRNFGKEPDRTGHRQHYIWQNKMNCESSSLYLSATKLSSLDLVWASILNSFGKIAAAFEENTKIRLARV
jgi:hypothetical protein